ncbi:transcription elongation factor A protein 3-like [Oncorhynchus keta]|uniref:transcription elongation factor A protein 3-like n=1 Tax=Oncorhynchus keta TaxID=8018 RepID=UPI00227C6285|nr:transcription elongation factor A protein 3-like [Oncorhynchus keta]
MTLKLLQETRIGMSVNGIRKHCTDDVVVSLSKILIKDWKRLLGWAGSRPPVRLHCPVYPHAPALRWQPPAPGCLSISSLQVLPPIQRC